MTRTPLIENLGTSRRDGAALFAPPRWLRDLGRTCWLLSGVLVVLVGLVWLLGATSTIVGPVIIATIIAVVAHPLVERLDEHMPRPAAVAVVLLGLVGIGVGVFVLVLAGINDQRGAVGAQAAKGVDHVKAWLEDLGVDPTSADSSAASVKHDVPAILSTLLHGVISGIRGITSVVFALSLTALSTFFLLKDGPGMRRWVDQHAGVPEPVARTVTGELGRSLRGYFRGVTFVAAFNGIVVFLGALVLGVPLAGTIGIVTFVTAYIPYLGAFAAGTLAVVVALGAKGTATAILMLLIVILANGLLQNIMQPFAMGSALELNPLIVLVVTIGAGCLFGTIGLILAAPIVAAASRLPRELRQLQATEPLDPIPFEP